MCHQGSLHFCSFHILVPLALNRFYNMNLKRKNERERRKGRRGKGGKEGGRREKR